MRHLKCARGFTLVDVINATLLISVDSLAFEYFERDGTPITDPALVTSRAASARVTVRTKGEATATQRTLVGRVRLRNSRF